MSKMYAIDIKKFPIEHKYLDMFENIFETYLKKCSIKHKNLDMFENIGIF